MLAGAASVTMVADRESDIYEQFARRPKGVQLLTRAAHDRCLAKAGRLFATIAAWPEQYRETILVPEQPGREARTACLALRFGAVSLRRPATGARLWRRVLTCSWSMWPRSMRRQASRRCNGDC